MPPPSQLSKPIENRHPESFLAQRPGRHQPLTFICGCLRTLTGQVLHMVRSGPSHRVTDRVNSRSVVNYTVGRSGHTHMRSLPHSVRDRFATCGDPNPSNHDPHRRPCQIPSSPCVVMADSDLVTGEGGIQSRVSETAADLGTARWVITSSS